MSIPGELRSDLVGTVAVPALPRLRYWTWGLPIFALCWLFVYVNFFPQPWALAKQNWPLFFVGFFGALLGNATAVGGGMVYIPVMVFIYKVNPIVALKLALADQCFGMTSGAIGWLKRGTIPLEALKVTIPAVVLGALLSTWVIQPSAFLVKVLFGPVSILIGLVLLMHRKTNRYDIPAHAKWPLFLVTLVGSLTTGWVAVGTGEFVAAFLMLAYGVRAERVIGLGVLLLAINSLLLTLLHQITWGGIPWEMVIFVGFGCVFGARLGPYLTQWIDQRRLKIGFAAIAIADGILFFVSYWWSTQ